jgi:hypothetical protein
MAERVDSAPDPTPGFVKYGLGCFAGAFLFVWIAGWSAGTLFFDAMIIDGLWKQYRSLSYQTTTGRVLDSKVETGSDSDGGTTYTPKIKYAYQIKGGEFTGDRLRHGMNNTSSSNADFTVAAYPPGRSVTVHYDADNPAEAVLEKGTSPQDIALPIFLVPFNIVMLGSWWFCLYGLRRLFFKPVAGGVEILERGTSTRVRLPESRPLFMAVVTALGVSFVLIFVVIFGVMFYPSYFIALAGWLVLIGITGGVYLKYKLPAMSGEQDLVIDDLRQSVGLPLTFGRFQPQEIKLNQIMDVHVVVDSTPDGEGGENKTYFPVIVWAEGTKAATTERLMQGSDREQAHAFADWLRGRLKLGQRT